jgi:uncharacterized membrane protein
VEGRSPPVRETVEFTRIVAFTDGVFAIAITLLVLSLEVPSDIAGADLHQFLLDSWRQLFAYFLSFAVIGRFWASHHDMFSVLNDFDRRLLALNLVYLSMVVLIPFPTELMGDYEDEVDPVVMYAAVVGTAAVLSWLMLQASVRRSHVRPGSEEQAARMAEGVLFVGIVFYVSIPFALLSPGAGQLFWLTLLLQGPAAPLYRRLARR